MHSKANVRRTGKTIGLDGLVASIASHGLRQNLNVKPTSGNRFEVVAGGRRLEALRRLAHGGTIDAQHPVPCLVLAEDEDATELSLAENAIRQDMHPDDQCDAFKALVDGGMPTEDVAARFGVAPTLVTQRLRLAGVSPNLRKLYRKGDLTLAHMMAFTLVDDHATQEAAWAGLADWQRTPQGIKNALTREGLTVNHRLASFVGLEAYEAAGGAVIRSLFEEDEPPVLADAALVQRLAAEKLEAVAVELRSEGWSWVVADADASFAGYGRIYARASDEETGALTFDPADLAKAGAIVALDWDGDIRIERGLVAPEVIRAEKPTPETADEPKGYADSVVADLTAHRTAAIRLEMARNVGVALGALAHAWALKVFYAGAYEVGSCLDLSHRSAVLDDIIRTPDEGTAHAALAEYYDEWQATLPADPSGLWDWCLNTENDRLLEFLSFLASLTVDAVVRTKQGARSRSAAHADLLADALSLDMKDHWHGKAEGFYGRLSKAQLAADLALAGETQRAADVMRLPKAEASAVTAGAMTKLQWLPAPLLPRDVRSSADDAPEQEPDAE